MGEDSVNMDGIEGVAAGKVEGDSHVVGKGNTVYRDSVVVMMNVSAHDRAQIEQIVGIAKEVSADRGGMAGQKLPSDPKGLEKKVDDLLTLIDRSEQQGKTTTGVRAGNIDLSKIELLLKKAVLIKAETEDMSEDSPERRRKLNQAYDLLSQAHEIDPTDTEVLLHLAQLLIVLTPDDPSDERKLLRRVKSLLENPKNDTERFRLAQATFLLATCATPADYDSLADARAMFERLGRTEWVRQCEGIRNKGQESNKTPENTRNAPPPQQQQIPMQMPQPQGFVPAGNWQIQVTDGSFMTFNLSPNGQFQGTQQNMLMGININAAGQWTFTPGNQMLQVHGVIQGYMPFYLGIVIQGPQNNGFIGVGTDGHGYFFTRI